MNDDIRSLIESLRRGQYDDPTEKIEALAAALREAAAGADFLIPLLRAAQVTLRVAALEAMGDSPDTELQSAVMAMVADPDRRVRVRLGGILRRFPSETARSALAALMEDADPGVRIEACRAVSGRVEHIEGLRDRLLQDREWVVRQAAAIALADAPGSAVVPALLHAIGHDDDADVRQHCATAVEQRLVNDPSEVAPFLPAEPDIQLRLQRALAETRGTFPELAQWLKKSAETAVDVAGLARYGTDLTAQAMAGILPRGYHLEQPLAAILRLLARQPVRSVALLGRSGCGKSSLVHELVHALAKPEHGGWRVLRMSPTDFMAGTKYVGEWETKLSELIAAVRRPRRILLYVPNLDELAAVGRWSKSDTNLASAIAPYLEDGSLLILGESTPEEFEKGLGSEVALARLFERVLVEDASIDATLAVLRSIRDEAGIDLDDDILVELNEAADHYLSHLARPGGSATLLRAVISHARESGQPVTRRGVLEVLSQSTGVPADLLDDGTPLAIADLHAFFEQRIMGQPEAVQAVLDLITLIKAGLTDPNKPYGVLLFVGPTGVGKTELARALAEYVFGSAERLVRFDMSEFASMEGFTRLIGDKGETGLLTDAVRHRPFSVVLFDEIEKSHINVFDLCLQLFDAGRLTDGRGRLVNFRRTIVILTSNIGAEAPGTPLGFGSPGSSPASPDADRDRTFRELSRFFRPEFLNRLDRIVHFRPLVPEVAERIARRELELVLQRGGVARRHLTVQLDPAVISLLVREGYSPHFGARPLKRTVERLVLLPLARAIAGGRLAPHDLITLAARDGRITVSITPRPQDSPPSPSPGSAGPSALPSPFADRVAQLESRHHQLDAHFATITRRRTELLAQTSRPGFYADDHEHERDRTFDELHRLDQFLARADRWKSRWSALLGRLPPGGGGQPPETAAVSRERLDELDDELAQIALIARAETPRDLCDALLEVRLAGAAIPNLDPVKALTEMISHFAQARHFTASILGGRHRRDGPEALWLQVVGLGAVALATPEAGLHEFRRRSRPAAPSRGSRTEVHTETCVVSVTITAWPSSIDTAFRKRLRIHATPVKPASSGTGTKDAWQIQLFDPESLRSLEGRFHGNQRDATHTAVGILWAQLSDEPGTPSAPVEVIRRYELGIGSCIRDLRTGRSTTRVAQVFRGRLDLLQRRDPRLAG